MGRISGRELVQRGASGIKFIAPLLPYGDESYFPLYEAVRDCHGLAVFHTGYQNRNSYDPGGFMERPAYMRMTDTRPSEVDRLARAFPDLKILMAHMGNPWWEDAFYDALGLPEELRHRIDRGNILELLARD